MTGYTTNPYVQGAQEIRIMTNNPLIYNLIMTTVEAAMKLENAPGNLTACNDAMAQPDAYYPLYLR